MSFWEAVFEIRRRDPRYPEDAYAFVMDALEYTMQRIGGKRHVSAAELLDGFCECAKARFGLMAWTVLERWGLTCTADVGTIVFQLVDMGELSRRESDSQSDFDDVLDLRTVLEDNYFDPPGESSRNA